MSPFSAFQPISISHQISNLPNQTQQNSPQSSQQASLPPANPFPASQALQSQPTLFNKSSTANVSFHHEFHQRMSRVILIIPEIDFHEPMNQKQAQLVSMMKSYFNSKNITDSDFIESIEELCNCVEKKFCLNCSSKSF